MTEGSSTQELREEPTLKLVRILADQDENWEESVLVPEDTYRFIGVIPISEIYDMHLNALAFGRESITLCNEKVGPHTEIRFEDIQSIDVVPLVDDSDGNSDLVNALKIMYKTEAAGIIAPLFLRIQDVSASNSPHTVQAELIHHIAEELE